MSKQRKSIRNSSVLHSLDVSSHECLAKSLALMSWEDGQRVNGDGLSMDLMTQWLGAVFWWLGVRGLPVLRVAH